MWVKKDNGGLNEFVSMWVKKDNGGLNEFVIMWMRKDNGWLYEFVSMSEWGRAIVDWMSLWLCEWVSERVINRDNEI